MVESAARLRGDYLRRPDLGRGLSTESRAALATRHAPCDLAIIVADGLSSTAVHQHAVPFIAALLPHLQRQRRTLTPVMIASQARVALGDEAAHALGARMALVLIGERPGLSSPDSLGAYLTFAPRPGLTDAARNCISNIRPGGLSFAAAAFKLAWLIDQGFARSLTGVDLKDESDAALAKRRKEKCCQGRLRLLSSPRSSRTHICLQSFHPHIDPSGISVRSCFNVLRRSGDARSLGD